MKPYQETWFRINGRYFTTRTHQYGKIRAGAVMALGGEAEAGLYEVARIRKPDGRELGEFVSTPPVRIVEVFLHHRRDDNAHAWLDLRTVTAPRPTPTSGAARASRRSIGAG